MKITLYNLVNILVVEDKISNQKLPIKVTYRLSKIFTRAREEGKFYQEKLLEILKSYGEKDEKGEVITTSDGSVSIQKDKIEECSKEIAELQNLEVELPDYTLSIEDFGNLEISMEELSPLIPFICEI